MGTFEVQGGRFLPSIVLVALSASGMARASEAFDGQRFYFGDIHAHTGVSGDGGSSDVGDCSGDCGSLAGISAHARSFGLDFLAVTDHANGITSASSSDFALGLEEILAQHDPDGGFVTIPGADLAFEDTETGFKFGHKLLLMFAANATLEGLDLEAVRPSEGPGLTVDRCDGVWEWADSFRAAWGDALLVPQHPSLTVPTPTDWSCHNSDYSPVVEVYSEHGSSMGLDDGFATPWSGEHGPGTIRGALGAHEHYLGFAAGSSNHDSRPGDPCRVDSVRTDRPYGQGFTVAVMDEGEDFDRSTLYQAFQNRRTYATTGPLLPVSIQWYSQDHLLGGMGGELVMPGGAALGAVVRVPEELVATVTDVYIHTPSGSFLAEAELDSGAWTMEFDPGEEPEWAYAEVLVDGELWAAGGDCDGPGVEPVEHLWLTPSWFEVQTDLDGDGWSIGEGDCDDFDAAVRPYGVELCDEAGDEDCNGLSDEDDPSCEEGDTGHDTGGPEADSGSPTVDTGEPEAEDSGRVLSGDSAEPDAPGADDPADKESKPSVGCRGCAMSTPPGIAWWALGLLLIIRRRAQ